MQLERRVLTGEVKRAHKDTMARDREILNWAISDDAANSQLLGPHARKVTLTLLQRPSFLQRPRLSSTLCKMRKTLSVHAKAQCAIKAKRSDLSRLPLFVRAH